MYHQLKLKIFYCFFLVLFVYNLEIRGPCIHLLILSFVGHNVSDHGNGGRKERKVVELEGKEILIEKGKNIDKI